MAGTGRVIAGRYRLKEPFGRGAMGSVWCGWDEVLDREVAVKELRISDSLPEEERAKAYQRTHREARTAARLSHPGLVTVFDVAEEDGCPWIVMELVHARSLDQIIAQDGPLSPPRAADAGRQLLAALATAHAAGVLHRDVKPSNVMLTENGRAVLTDFGIATFQGDPRLTQTGMVMGSPGFTAPERIQGNAATPASDLWSLGATLYAAVEGHGPFDRAGGAITTMSAIINTDPPTAPIAAGLGAVIDGLLRRNPAERPDAATAARMLGAIGPLPDGSMSAGGYTPTSYAPVLPRQSESGSAADGGASAGAFGAAVSGGAAGASAVGVANGSAAAATTHDAAGAGAGAGAGENPGAIWVDGNHEANEVAGAAGAWGAGALGAGGVLGAGALGAEGALGAGALEAAGSAVAAGTSVDLPAREDSTAVDGAGAGPAAPGAPAPRSGSSPGGWAAPPPPKAAAWATAPPKTATPGKTAAVPPMPGTTAIGQPDPNGPTGPSGPDRGRNGRRTLLIAAGVAVVLIAVAACLLLLRAHRQAKPTSPAAASGSGAAAQARTPTTAAAGVASTVLPAGWQWYTASAKTLGTNAGFKLAIPDGWNAYSKGDGVLFEAPGNDMFLQVNLTPHTKSSMLAEAWYLTQQKGKFPGYSDQSIRAVNIRNSAGAAWSFTWQDSTLGRIRALDLMYNARTSAGQQSFALYMSSPDAAFTGNMATFIGEMRTFQSVP
ncbi:MAG TPA: serine/threonine-protein kinase [Streptosporangiaceae bacterium]